MPTGNRDLYFLFFLINFVIMAAVGTTLIFLSLIISKTSDIKFSQNVSLFFISGTKIIGESQMRPTKTVMLVGRRV